MADTEISVYNGLNTYNVERLFIIESLRDDSESNINFKNNTYSLEEDKFLLDNKQFTNFNFSMESKYFSTIRLTAPAESVTYYNMRAKRVSNNSFIYWSSTTLDTLGEDSGFNFEEIYDICFLGIK